MNKTIMFIIAILISNIGLSQCPEIVYSENIYLNNDTGSCGAVVNYETPFILDTCSNSIFYEDFESGAPGWTKGMYSSFENWIIQDYTGTGTQLNSNMFGVPHSGNYSFGGAEHSFIESPSFNTMGGGVFSFDYFVNNEPAFHDKEIIEISFDNGGTWNQIFGDQLVNDAYSIQSLSYNITAAQGSESTKVRFIYNTVDACCGAQDGFFIDNVGFNKEITVQQISGLGTGSLFPIGTTTEVYEVAYNNIVDTVSFDVIIISINNTTQTLSICNGESILVGNNVYSVTGVYIDTLSNTTGCDSIVTTNLTIKDPIDTSLTVNNSLITSNELSADYQWVDYSNGLMYINGETNREFIVTAAGSYAVILTKEGCQKTSSIIDVLTTEIESNLELIEFNLGVCPNPATDKIYISTNKEINKTEISIIDITGKEVYRRKKFNNNMINISSFASGIYYLRVNYLGESKTVKFIKE